MIGSIIGAGMSAAAGIFGGIQSAKAMSNVQSSIEKQKAQNEAWYNRRYNEDATQRADAQRLLQKTEEAIRNRNRQAAATAAVMGGTEESVAATKAANAQAYADAVSQIAANAEARKDGIESAYQQRNAAFAGQLNDLERQKAEAISQAVQGVAKTGSGIAGAF